MPPSNTPIVCRLLKNTRKRRKLTLDQVCRGICSKSNLSRMETGKVRPDINQIRMFFSRIGVKVPKKLVTVTRWEKMRYDIEHEMFAMFRHDDTRRLPLIEEYIAVRPDMAILEQQVLLHNKALYESSLGENRQNAISLCEKALSLTNTIIGTGNDVEKQTLSKSELGLLNMIAHSNYYFNKNGETPASRKEFAIDMELYIKEYHEKNIEKFEYKESYSLNLFNLSNWKGMKKNMMKQ